MNEQENPQTQRQGATAVAPVASQATPPQTQMLPPQPGPTVPNLRRLLLINGLGFLVVLIIALGIFYIWHQSYYFYSTDDAVVTGSVINVAAPSPGTIVAVNYGLGSNVSAGNTVATLRLANGAVVAATSPINGTIINEGATPGEVLPAGQPIAQVVDLSRLFITAYVEEGAIRNVHTGEGVDVTVDAVQGTTFHGSVTQILPATASTFSPLPTTDYASGNFTKVSQRIPVVITLDGYQGHSLYPGESSSVTVHIHS